jgi:hypothetical protein
MNSAPRSGARSGADYQNGAVLCAGDHAFALVDRRNLAMPLARLWEM